MRKLIEALIVLFVRAIFAYGVILLFALDFNVFNWTLTERIWLLIITLILFSSKVYDEM